MLRYSSCRPHFLMNFRKHRTQAWMSTWMTWLRPLLGDWGTDSYGGTRGPTSVAASKPEPSLYTLTKHQIGLIHPQVGLSLNPHLAWQKIYRWYACLCVLFVFHMLWYMLFASWYVPCWLFAVFFIAFANDCHIGPRHLEGWVTCAWAKAHRHPSSAWAWELPSVTGTKTSYPVK
jgi:hypothetical protein